MFICGDYDYVFGNRIVVMRFCYSCMEDYYILFWMFILIVFRCEILKLKTMHVLRKWSCSILNSCLYLNLLHDYCIPHLGCYKVLSELCRYSPNQNRVLHILFSRLVVVSVWILLWLQCCYAFFYHRCNMTKSWWNQMDLRKEHVDKNPTMVQNKINPLFYFIY